jgi:hypothetical protein
MTNSQRRAIGEGIVSFLNGISAVQAVGTVALDRSLKPHPRYPTDPVADCPRLVLQANQSNHERGTTQATNSVHDWSLWIYLRQTSGADQQAALEVALKAIEDQLLFYARPASPKAAGADLITPYQASIHDEISHPLTDRPRLRVSVGELQIRATTRQTGVQL